jgi:hypothetical protein
VAGQYIQSTMGGHHQGTEQRTLIAEWVKNGSNDAMYHSRKVSFFQIPRKFTDDKDHTLVSVFITTTNNTEHQRQIQEKIVVKFLHIFLPL